MPERGHGPPWCLCTVARFWFQVPQAASLRYTLPRRLAAGGRGLCLRQETYGEPAKARRSYTRALTGRSDGSGSSPVGPLILAPSRAGCAGGDPPRRGATRIEVYPKVVSVTEGGAKDDTIRSGRHPRADTDKG